MENQLTTVFYRYNPYATIIILGYVLLFVVFFFFSIGFPGYVTAIGIAILVIPPLFAAMSKKPVFSIRSWDKRKLTFSSTFIRVGDREYAVAALRVALYVHGFQGFSYSKNHRWITRNSIYGDRNAMSFRDDHDVYDFEFFLKDYKAFKDLYRVVEDWKAAGVTLVVKEYFPPEFVHDQVKRFFKKG